MYNSWGFFPIIYFTKTDWFVIAFFSLLNPSILFLSEKTSISSKLETTNTSLTYITF